LEASIDRVTWKAAAFWQRVATKFCDPDLNWTITAKTAQMRSSQRIKPLPSVVLLWMTLVTSRTLALVYGPWGKATWCSLILV